MVAFPVTSVISQPPAPQLALKLSTQGAQKHPGSQIMRALRAVALERCGRMEEAVQVGQCDPLTCGQFQ
jgi:hypothetical protein